MRSHAINLIDLLCESIYAFRNQVNQTFVALYALHLDSDILNSQHLNFFGFE